MSSKKTELDLSDELIEKLRQRASKVGAESVEEYILLLVSEVLAEEQDSGGPSSDSSEEDVRKQLEGLGYM